MNNAPKQAISDFIKFTNISDNTAIEILNLTIEEWKELKAGNNQPTTTILTEMLSYSMSHRIKINTHLLESDLLCSDSAILEVEQLDAITTLLHTNKSKDIQQIGNLIAGNVTRLLAIFKSN